MTTRRTKTEHQSELWERLRAARHYADLTQDHIAKALGVSRSAIALHESRAEAIRTRPSADQVMKIGLLTGIPPEFLLSDEVRAEDVWKYANKTSVNIPTAPAATDKGALATRDKNQMLTALGLGGDRQARTFWAAVEHQVTVARPELESCFAKPVEAGGANLQIDFYHAKNIATFAVSTPDVQALITSGAGGLLLLERALHKACIKHLLIWHRPGCPALDTESIETAWGIKAHMFTSAHEAAEYLLAL